MGGKDERACPHIRVLGIEGCVAVGEVSWYPYPPNMGLYDDYCLYGFYLVPQRLQLI